MRKAILSVAFISVILAASAHTGHQKAAVTPDHPIYDTKLSVEKQIEALAPNDTARVEARIERADTRLAETSTLVDRNETELANRSLESFSKEIRGMENFSQGVNDTAQKRRIDELVANATARHTEVLSRVYERVPEQARKGIERAMNQSVKGHRKAVGSLNRTGNVPESVKQKDPVSKAPEGIRDSLGEKKENAGGKDNKDKKSGKPANSGQGY